MEIIEPAEHLSNCFSQLFVTLPVLDIRKSCDCVPPEILVGKLSLEFNFCTDAYNITESYLCDRELSMQVKGYISTCQKLTAC